jgi:organic hydroperoxide reductase OsmC/OhrA
MQEGTIMQDFPHHYSVAATASADGDVLLESERLPPLQSASPAEFGGPGDRWSPETLLAASVADCFVLTFRAIAAIARLPWISLRCEVVGTLDRIEKVTQFTSFTVRARLQVPEDGREDQAQRLLEKAERGCLITNSLKAATHLEAQIDVATPQ